jgi:WD40 repeat protein
VGSRPGSAGLSSRPASAGRGRRPSDSNSSVSTPTTPVGADDDSLTRVTGITVVAAKAVGGSGASVGTKSVQLIATTNMGKAVRAEIGKWMGNNISGTKAGDITSIRGVSGPTSNGADIRPLFYYHSGAVTALAAEMASIGTIFATGGDDRRLCIWDSVDRSLLARVTTQACVRCVNMDQSGQFIAAGFASGGFSIYSLAQSPSNRADSTTSSSFRMNILEECFRKDAREEVSDIKFSPSNIRLAVGSKDCSIYIYKCALAPGGCALRSLHKLTGHSSHITHLGRSQFCIGAVILLTVSCVR